MTIEDALGRLRAADPAAGVEPSWAGPPAVADPRRHRPTAVWLAAAAAVLLVVGIAAAVAVPRGSGDGSRRSAAPLDGNTPPPDFIRPGQKDPHVAANQRYAASAFVRLPVVPGAERRTAAPSPALRTLWVVPGTGDGAVHLSGWWTSGLTPDEANKAFAKALPATFRQQGGSGPFKGVLVAWFQGPTTASTADLTVGFSTLQTSAGTAIRVDLWATPRPSRTTDSFIPQPSSVVVTYRVDHLSPKAPSSVVSRSFRGPVARDLADRVNGLPSITTFPLGCPMRSAEVTQSAVFRAGDRTWTLTLSSCGGSADLASSSTKATRALAPDDLADRLREMLGLPEGWGTK